MQAHSCTQCTVYSVHSVHGTVYSVHSAQCMGVRGGKLSQRDLTLQGIVVSLPSTQRVLLCICYLRYHNHHRCHQSGSFCFLLEPDYPCASTFKFMLQTVAAEKCPASCLTLVGHCHEVGVLCRLNCVTLGTNTKIVTQNHFFGQS